MATNELVMPRSGHKAVRVGADGSRWIEGLRCPDCRAVVAERAMACPSCGGRRPLEPVRAGPAGTLYSWAIIHRSYPGIAVPFISAIVDLDGGLTIKGTLRGIAPAALRAGMKVRAEMDDAGGAVDKDGTPYVGFHFVIEGDAK